MHQSQYFTILTQCADPGGTAPKSQVLILFNGEQTDDKLTIMLNVKGEV
jgi:hypothetical protein